MKKRRLKIKSIDDLKSALVEEGYKIELTLKQELMNNFNINEDIATLIVNTLEDSKITYRAECVKAFIDYIHKLKVFEKEHKKLSVKISSIDKLIIGRVEYHREPSPQQNVEHIIKCIDNLTCNITSSLTKEEMDKFHAMEKELKDGYLYSKDIELLKKIVSSNNENLKENYNTASKIKTITVNIPTTLGINFMKSEKGSVEYHNHISSYIPRIKRLRKNIDKYLEATNDGHKINQSSALLDSMNIAYATYDNKEFKALSGDVDVRGYCNSPKEVKFKSVDVNRLGQVGTGYTRENDSEKKILEEIHNQIENKILKESGELTLCTKWEPCPSCYYVLSQFIKEHPKVKINIKYKKKYGEGRS
ncbi:MAG: deaminase domain-containing protein [Clostridium sp.]